MKLQDQLTSLELARKLKKLGVKQESLWYWNRTTEKLYSQKERNTLSAVWNETTWYSAFTVAELGEMLPRRIEQNKNNVAWLQIEVQGIQKGWSCQYHYFPKGVVKFFETRTMSNCMAKMLIYLLENRLINK